MAKFVTAQEAISQLKDGMTVGIGGFGAYSPCDELLEALAERFRNCGHPQGLTIVAGICGGNNTEDNIAFNRLREPGLVETLIAAHIGNAPVLAGMIRNNEIAGFLLPLGVVMHLYRAAAGRKPGVLTHVGKGTFADPRIEGCRANDKAREQGREVVSLLTINGQDSLFYPTILLDACLIRGSYADEDGNISIQREAITGEQLELAEAVHNNGGVVIVQVERIVKQGSLHPRDVRIHKSLVDYVVRSRPENHLQGYSCPQYRPELVGEIRIPTQELAPMPLNIRKVVARRAAMELRPGSLINLGIGIPSGVASVANEEGIAGQISISVESGPMGGVPVEGVGFAASVNAETIYSICDIFDQYDGGILDMACLGAGEIDQKGNVNVSKFGSRCTGPGGFINITQNAHSVCFLGTFTAGKVEANIGSGVLKIKKDGTRTKFVKEVEQITFSADFARQAGQNVLYITERAVFRLTDEGVTLTEIAPGADLQRDILDRMDFMPCVAKDLHLMDERIFIQARMLLNTEGEWDA